MTEPAAVSAQGTELKASIDIDASPAPVWALVTDVKRTSQWSPQVVRSIVLGGQVGLGTRFVNLNHQGWKHWPTSAKVVRFTPHSDFAFRITENRTIWSYQLEPTATGGTLLTNRRETPDGIAQVSDVLVGLVLGGQKQFVPDLLKGMSQTLGRIQAEAEAS